MGDFVYVQQLYAVQDGILRHFEPETTSSHTLNITLIEIQNGQITSTHVLRRFKELFREQETIVFIVPMYSKNIKTQKNKKGREQPNMAFRHIQSTLDHACIIGIAMAQLVRYMLHQPSNVPVFSAQTGSVEHSTKPASSATTTNNTSPSTFLIDGCP